MDLIHATETFDLIVVGVAYLAMHYTFISLYLSMQQLGSKFWLATSVMLSSTFAFMFAFVTSFYLGVPVSIMTLSEGLPFLVVTIGFGNKDSDSPTLPCKHSAAESPVRPLMISLLVSFLLKERLSCAITLLRSLL